MPTHYTPRPRFRSDDASTYARAMYEALQPWITGALGGEKRHRIASPNTPNVNRAPDDILCDCAAALAESVEWEGGLLAHRLACRGWPVDIELVRDCHKWSCELKDKVMANLRARARGARA